MILILSVAPSVCAIVDVIEVIPAAYGEGSAY